MLALFTSVVVALAGFAVAQNSSSTLDPGSVSLTMKSQWCQGENTNCPLLCGGPTFTKINTCSASDFTYTCTCSNGTGPTDIDQYLDTWPNHVCNEIFAQCRQANPGSESCKTCGTLVAKNVPAMTSTMAAATTAMATGGSTSAGAAASPTATKGAAAEKMVPMGFLGLMGALLL
ncbi:MAG: hypothetical protein OHK93_004778 [Ramalina farinacea]|uniref:DUF7707 domain-containing protein n=1 Tax=Ramalina farinacea TaxID=258253 RepID=A0AA43QWQ2_9LECA|nr:hypothetical protein [Ramalina farinacea]